MIVYITVIPQKFVNGARCCIY